MSIYALVKDGFVENTVIWDGEGDLFPDYQAVELNENENAGPGWTYDGTEFYPPVEPEKSHEELVAEAEQQKEALLSEAQTTISLWQTELQLGIISDEDKASLIAWVQYIKAVQAIDTSKAPDITWPVPPAA
ncbi:tail fiber assembly protein [Enterobacter kobei]|uniref:tail fiber assembly protein n=1 Tax=Enterobacter kobei TaxID=208224 RepID=UPI002985801F|nr:tail fiber assembly protein [Enterobacter kobei]HEG2198262.1 tail fiber assembly protein [Enterobacter kobei]